MYFGYLNDDYYGQFLHQLVFSATEIYSAVILLKIATNKQYQNGQNRISSLMKLVTISSAHLAVGAVDQFFVQIFTSETHISFTTRDFGFIISDILTIVIPLNEIARDRISGNLTNISYQPVKHFVMFSAIFFITVIL